MKAAAAPAVAAVSLVAGVCAGDIRESPAAVNIETDDSIVIGGGIGPGKARRQARHAKPDTGQRVANSAVSILEALSGK